MGNKNKISKQKNTTNLSEPDAKQENDIAQNKSDRRLDGANCRGTRYTCFSGEVKFFIPFPSLRRGHAIFGMEKCFLISSWKTHTFIHFTNFEPYHTISSSALFFIQPEILNSRARPTGTRSGKVRWVPNICRQTVCCRRVW